MNISSDPRRLALLCDFYELTMAGGYFRCGLKDKISYFDVFYRRNPDGGGYAIATGLEQIIDYVRSLHFDDDDIAYLRGRGIFGEDFLTYLRNFKFTGDIWAVTEGTVIFPDEPIMIVRAPAIEAQFIETFILLTVNHQTLIATKASRIVRAADGRPVSEFGARRAHGADAALYGARAAYIGGCSSTSCTIADAKFGVMASGTMAHSWVQMFDSEYESFKTYCELYPDKPTLLVDTYSVLSSGVPNAIAAFTEVLTPLGLKECAIRLDSGDITDLSKKARAMLDAAGFYECKIVASNSLDEYTIRDMLRDGAQIDVFGVGERLITAKSDPVFGGVYKLAAVENDGVIVPKIKISENAGKITNPHFKTVYRIISNETGKAEADVVCVHGESIDETAPLEICDPDSAEYRTIVNFTAVPLLTRIFKSGECVYDSPSVSEMRANTEMSLTQMRDDVLRLDNPREHNVMLSLKLRDVKERLLKENL
jgi:putative nicotinate phosphoribosyltransferase